jgi:hypothetical protein
VLVAVLLAGCAADAPKPIEAPDDARFACDPSVRPATVPLRRLSHAEYVYAVNDLVASSGLGGDDVAAVQATLQPLLAMDTPDVPVPAPSERAGGFAQLDQRIQAPHVELAWQVAVTLGQELTSTPARLGVVVGDCAIDDDTTNDAACLEGFLNRFGARVLRRPLDRDDLDFYEATPELADVIALLFTAPQFLYVVEDDDTLDPWALAARLSLHFWQTIPDDALNAAAASGALSTPDGYAAQVERLASDPRGARAFEDFFAQWLRLELMPPLDGHDLDPSYVAFAGTDLPSPTLHLEMQRELLDAIDDARSKSGSLSDLLTSRSFVAKSSALARIYGQPAWDGVSLAPVFSDPTRVGLLTRAALLAAPGLETRPVLKGLTVVNGLMCQSIGAPPPEAPVAPPPAPPSMTTREALAALTEQPGSGCSGCHSVLDPFGDVTESFDALGRWRGGDTHATVIISGAPHDVATVAELNPLLVQSGELQSCFARQAFRFAFRRLEDDTADACALGDLQALALHGASLSTLWTAVAYSPEFQRRLR